MSFLKTDKPSGAGLFGGGGKSRFDTAPARPVDEIDGENLEQHAARVLTEAEQAFRDRAKAETERFELATDTEYWCAIGFQSRRQKDAFLAALRERFGLADDGDKYLDGWEVAKALGIELPREQVPYNTSAGKVDKKWLSLAR